MFKIGLFLVGEGNVCSAGVAPGAKYAVLGTMEVFLKYFSILKE